MVAKKPLYPDDRRGAPRFSVGEHGWIITPRSVAGTIENLSVTGLLFKAASAPVFPVGEVVRIVFQISATEASLKLDAVVARHESPNGMGLEFQHLMTFERHAIQAFVVEKEKRGIAPVSS